MRPVAIRSIATVQTKAQTSRQPAAAAPHWRLILCIAAGTLLWSSPGGAADKVRLTGLADLAFGTVGNLGLDAVRARDVCIYSNSVTSGYHVTATGTGAAGAFELSSGTDALPFDVAWNSAPGQSSGAILVPNVPLTGQISSATQQTCNSGASTTASLIIILRTATLSSSTAGNYTGTLTLVVGPE
jgi:hypothetical protein